MGEVAVVDKNWANDGGWRSRKLWFAAFTSVLIFGAALWGSESESFRIIYPEMVMGLIGVASLFFGANSFSRWTLARNAPAIQAAAEAMKPPTPPAAPTQTPELASENEPG